MCWTLSRKRILLTALPLARVAWTTRSLNRIFASIAGVISHIVRMTPGLNQHAQEFRLLTGASLKSAEQVQKGSIQIQAQAAELQQLVVRFDVGR